MHRTPLILRLPLGIVFRSVALILASNYFAFQVELFDDEYEANHPRQTEGCSLVAPTLNWESFDKNNAPQPFVFDALITIECAGPFAFPMCDPVAPHYRHRDVRDKSPPPLA